MSESYRLHLKDGILHCESSREGYEILTELTKFIPANDNQDFKAMMDYLRTRKWKGTYDSPAMDGTNWNLIVEADSISINTGGSNLYPSGFHKFLKLLNAITLPAGIRVS